MRDGCFFAGFLLAGEGGSDEDVQTCLQALREMRWAFSKGEEREKTVRMIWESRKGSNTRPCTSISPTLTTMFELQPAGTQFLRTHSQRPQPPPRPFHPCLLYLGFLVWTHRVQPRHVLKTAVGLPRFLEARRVLTHPLMDHLFRVRVGAHLRRRWFPPTSLHPFLRWLRDRLHFRRYLRG